MTKTISPCDTGKRFILDRVEISPQTGCWNWTGGIRATTGHPLSLYWPADQGGKVSLTPSRLSYIMFVGDPGDSGVGRQCRNRLCCNPAHLRLYTNAKGGNTGGPTRPAISRIYDWVKFTDDGCHIWTGATSGYRVPKITVVTGHGVCVQRWLFTETVRPLAPNEILRNTHCDNPLCVNLDHWTPTQIDLTPADYARRLAADIGHMIATAKGL